MAKGKHKRLTPAQLSRELNKGLKGKPSLYGPRWRLAYNSARARAAEDGREGVALEVRRDG